MGKRIGALIVALAVGMSTCGGGDDGSVSGSTSGAPSESSRLDPDVLEFADSVVASLGP